VTRQATDQFADLGAARVQALAGVDDEVRPPALFGVGHLT